MSKCTLVIPVYNEENIILENMNKLLDFLDDKGLLNKFQIIIAENGSTDKTFTICSSLTKKHENVRLLRNSIKGRGRSLQMAWKIAKTEMISYMDADLPFRLEDYLNAVGKLEDCNADLVCGSRVMEGAYVKRPLIREVLSRIFNLLVKTILRIKISDSQCGLKVLKKRKFLKVVDKIRDGEWFFDTELIFWFQQLGYVIKETPICCNMENSTKVRIIRDALTMGVSILRLLQQKLKWEEMRFNKIKSGAVRYA